MADIKPIETEYNGYRFRSRLEAKWAVFFDEADIKYEYEPEGFQLEDGSRYLPDFYLPEYRCYVEVKASDAFKITYDTDEETVTFQKGYEKYGQAAHDIIWGLKHNYLIVFGDPVDVFSLKTMGHSSHMFTLSECPHHVAARLNPEDEYICADTGENCHECDHCYMMASGQWCGVATLNNSDYLIQGNRGFLPNIYDGIIPLDMFVDFQTQGGEKFSYKDLMPFAKKARQARFEHGETPTK
jgi:hypothetical protein